MTASTIDFTGAGPFAFNYTTGTGIYGTNAMKNISGVYALWAGDANGDGQIVFTRDQAMIRRPLEIRFPALPEIRVIYLLML